MQSLAIYNIDRERGNCILSDAASIILYNCFSRVVNQDVFSSAIPLSNIYCKDIIGQMNKGIYNSHYISV